MRGESLSSMLAGATSLTMGLGTTIVLMSCLVGQPIGAADLFEHETVYHKMFKSDGTSELVAASRTMPSLELMSILFVGACVAGLGIALARMQRPERGCLLSRIALAVCVVGSLLGWGMIMRAVWS